jgi:predicted RNA-binding Zn-ribbon protein involved in translation (DUF1610 family)
MRRVEKEVEIECPKCGSKSKAKANSFFDSIYSCECGEIVVVKKLSGIEARE